MVNYIINPVKATCMKYSGRDHGIQGLNDTCFNVCASYSETYDTYNMDPSCVKACEDFIEKRKREIFGVGSCDHQVPYRPVAWQETPRYFPKLLRKGLNPDQARSACKNLCKQKTGSLSAQCEEDCDTDANAIELFEKPISQAVTPPTSENNKPIVKSEQKNISKWVGISLVILFIFFGVAWMYSQKLSR